MIVDGRNGGTVELMENLLVIRRQGVASFLTQGLKGEKRIPYSSITSVQFKEAGFTTGYIQFGVTGAIESRGGVWDATTDENTVLFTKEAAEDFRRLRDIVEDRAARARSGSVPPAQSQSPSVVEELTRLADLRDRGALSEEEFAKQKAVVLSKQASSDGQQQASMSPKLTSSLRSPVDATRKLPAKKSAVGRIAGVGCLVLLGILVLLTMIDSRIERTFQNADSGAPSAAVAVAPASLDKSEPVQKDFVSTQAARSLDEPIIIGSNGPKMDACGSNGRVVGLDARGDNFLAVKSGPRMNASRIDKLGPAFELYVCGTSKDGKWLGVVYQAGGQLSTDCGVTSPVATARAYSGRCQSGWVYSKYVDVYAG
jgi:uncharacterized protein DUF4429/putative oligomerization/nucleic acid binding protein